jgi:TrmH family RNA methyltransferase
MQPITSSNSKRYKDALQLHRSRGRKKQNRIIVFGWREVLRAITSGVQPQELFLCEDASLGEQIQKLRTLLADHDTSEEDRLYLLAAPLFQSLSYGDRNNGVIMTAGRPDTELTSLGEKIVDSQQDSLIVVCERLENPGNLGGLIRSADGSAAAAVIVADALTDAFHPNAIRNSAGAVFRTPVATASAVQIQKWLLERDYRVLIATPDADDAFFAKNLTGRCAIVLGNEAAGVSERWRQLDAVEPFQLPMLGVADSLNVSVTGAILMYESLRQKSDVGPSGA